MRRLLRLTTGAGSTAAYQPFATTLSAPHTPKTWLIAWKNWVKKSHPLHLSSAGGPSLKSRWARLVVQRGNELKWNDSGNSNTLLPFLSPLRHSCCCHCERNWSRFLHWQQDKFFQYLCWWWWSGGWVAQDPDSWVVVVIRQCNAHLVHPLLPSFAHLT